MALGDDAIAAGLDIVNGATADLREGADEITRTRDYVGAHMRTGTHSMSRIIGLAAALAGKADLPFVMDILASVEAKAERDQLLLVKSGQFDLNVWNRAITWTRQPAYIGNSSGEILLGYAPSTRDSKQDIAEVPWTREQLLAVPLIHYRYIAEVAKAAEDPDYSAALEVGTIADDLHELGLWEFVIYEGRGEAAVPRGVRYELLGLAALWLAQDAHARLTDIESRLEAGGL